MRGCCTAQSLILLVFTDHQLFDDIGWSSLDKSTKIIGYHL
jgi:hypothetical protein